MSKTPRIDKVRATADSYSRRAQQTGALFLMAEMLERIAIALEKEERK